MTKNTDSLGSTDFRKDGYWMSFRSGVVVRIEEHQTDIRKPAIAARLGVSEKVRQQIATIPVRYGDEDVRREVLLLVMRTASLIRIRGHGDHIAFQFWAGTSGADAKARKAIKGFCRRLGVGAYMGCEVQNLAAR